MEQPANSPVQTMAEPGAGRAWGLRLSVAGAALLSLLAFAPMVWHVDNTFRTYRTFLQSHQGTEDLHDRAVLLNQRLMLETREHVACGDDAADSRRPDLENQLESTLTRLEQGAAPCRVGAHSARADAARIELRRLEHQALALGGVGRIDQAQKLLQSHGYWGAQEIFNSQLDSLVSHCSSNWNRTLDQERAREFRALAGAGAILVLSLGTWLGLLRRVENRERRLRQEFRERQRTGARLTTALTRCERLFHEACESIFLVDPASGRILDANRRAAQLSGYSRDELRNLTLPDLDVGLATEPAGTSSLAGWPGRIEQRRHRRRDGTLLAMEVSSHLVNDGGSTILQCFCRDVTERLRLEQQLGQAQKMECVGRVAGGIVHDFSNLLIAIRGYADLAGRSLEEGHPAANPLHQVEAATAEAIAVSRSLLAFARGQGPAEERVDLGQLVAGVIQLLRPALPAGVTLATEVETAQALVVMADRTALQQAVLNLGLNAQEALPRGGLIVVSLERQEDTAVIGISDNGEGIAPELLDRIWEPFFTTRTGGRGTGLGLTSVKTTVENCGGTLQVDPRSGGGTRFLLRLPLVEGAADPAAIPTGPTTGHGAGRLVALADPHGFAREVMAEALRGLGFVVQPSASAQELRTGLAAAPSAAGSLALAIIDLDLPGAGGLNVLQEVRRHDPELPVILMGGRWEAAPEADLDRHTVVLCKPFPMNELCRLALGLCRPSVGAEGAHP